MSRPLAAFLQGRAFSFLALTILFFVSFPGLSRPGAASSRPAESSVCATKRPHHQLH
jgi:hypothetical protein